MAKELLELVDGLIIPGGQDVAPIMFHGEPSVHTGASYQPRDEIEFQLVREAKKMGKPLFGICRGIQVVNLALGGSVYQDLESEFPSHDLLQHKQKTLGSLPVHTVKIQKGSLLNQVFGDSAYVNSRHHQAVKNVAAGLHVVAQAPDGVIEGLEDDQGLIQLVQWHPENLWQSDLKQEELFKAFFRRVSEYK
jgi:putative glutamine amidotransferase